MCTFTTTSEKVKVIGYLDLTITTLTVVIIGYGVILPDLSYSSSASLEPQSSRSLERDRDMPKESKPLDPFKFWLPVGLWSTVGLLGILWSLVLIKTSAMEAHRNKEMYSMLGYWLICNVVLAAILSYLWIWVVSIDVTQEGSHCKNLVIQISYGSCYLFRILLLFLVWRERRNISSEREMTDEDIRRCTANVGLDGNCERRPTIGMAYKSKPFYCRNQQYHNPQNALI